MQCNVVYYNLFLLKNGKEFLFGYKKNHNFVNSCCSEKDPGITKGRVVSYAAQIAEGMMFLHSQVSSKTSWWESDALLGMFFTKLLPPQRFSLY